MSAEIIDTNCANCGKVLNNLLSTEVLRMHISYLVLIHDLSI